MRACRVVAATVTAALLTPASVAGQAPQQVDVQGRRVEYVRVGQGNPTIVFESGAAGDWAQWQPVREALGDEFALFMYSRAGHGASEQSLEPRDPVTLARELHAVLQAVEVQPPYVLVGQSLGGLIVRIFGGLYSDETAALMYVDSTHPRQLLASEAVQPGSAEQFWATISDSAYLAGIKELYGLSDVETETIVREVRDLGSVLESGEVQGVSPPPDVPTIVLTALKLQPELGITEETAAMMRALHGEFFQNATLGAHIVSRHVGHEIHREDPALVARSLQRLMDWVPRS